MPEQRISIELNPLDVERIKIILTGVKKGSQRVFRNGNNATYVTVRKEIVNIIRGEINVTATRMKKEFDAVSKKATLANSTAVIGAPRKGLLLAFFSPRALKQGFSVAIKPGGARTKYPEDYLIKGALRYTKGTPKAGTPAQRKSVVTDPRKPSEWHYGPSPSQAWQQYVKSEPFRVKTNQTQQKNIQREVQRLLASL
jgi:hypothetical protein